MKGRNSTIVIVIVSLLLTVGIASAQQPLPLPAATIPQFVEPLPLLEFEFINATSGTLPGVLAGLPPKGEHCVTPDPLGPNGCTCVPDPINPALCQLDAAGNPIPDMVPTTPFPIDAYEFRSQILPSLAKWPTAPLTCGTDTASSVWGYISDPALLGGIRPTYLGPVVIAETGVMSSPVYGNNLPLIGSIVQANLPIDLTLDWADPAGTTGPAGCLPDPLFPHPYTNTNCGLLPWTGEIPIATHLHGGEVPPAFDGGPDAWFTQGNLTVGAGWPGSQYDYPNNQQEGTIWFHDHALGITRLNVYAGLAGLQPIIDPANPPLTVLPNIGDGYDIPLIIQDRTFAPDCQIMYNLASNPQPNLTVHPFWIPEFIGDTIVVNGKTWPFLNVEPRQYRFRLVNGSNARFYDLQIQDARTTLNKQKVKTVQSKPLPLLVIATDDGYLMNVASSNNIVIGTGERYEIIVDFRAALPGQQFLMTNSARTPFPGGGAPVKGLTDRVMMFNVVPGTVDPNTGLLIPPSTTVAVGDPLRDPVANPIVDIKTQALANKMLPAPNPTTGTIVRQLTLNEVIGPGGPLELVVNNSKFNLARITPGCQTTVCRETEIPQVGDTEIWEIINITADAHPMHTHLTSFQVIDRTPFQAGQWIANYDALLLAAYPPPLDPGGMGPPFDYSTRNADGAIGGNPAVGPFLQLNGRRLPAPSEQGWKDTVITYPGEVTRIAVRWAPTDLAVGAATPGSNQYVGFDPTALVPDPNDPTGATLNVGYVWHCHIIDHEDNEMMRNYTVGALRQPVF